MYKVATIDATIIEKVIDERYRSRGTFPSYDS